MVCVYKNFQDTSKKYCYFIRICKRNHWSLQAHGFFNKFLTNSTVVSDAFRSISLISWMWLNFLLMGSDHFSVWPCCRLTFFVNGLVVSDMIWTGIFHPFWVSRTPICVRPKITRAHSLAPSLRPIWNFSSLSSWYDAVNEIRWSYQYFFGWLVLEESASRSKQ